MDAAQRDLAAALARAIRAGDTLPKMSPGLDVDAAYAVQQAVVAAVAGGAVAGFKAGMTAPAAQAAFGLTHPLIGSLYASGRLAAGAKVAGAPASAWSVRLAW